MDDVTPCENYPVSMIFTAVLVNVSIYALGAAILSGFGNIPFALYLFYCLGMEIHVMRKSCVDCYYYGKWCAFGKGKAAPLFFEKGDPRRFSAKQISSKDLLPDLLVPLIPLGGGVALLVLNFSWTVTIMLAALLALSSSGNFFVRSKLACKYCKQRELGCPAEQFFGKQRAL